MNAVKGRLNIHAIGGCGINVISKIRSGLSKLEKSEFTSDIKIDFLDTTRKSMSKFELNEDKFYLVESSSSLNSSLDGTAGERNNKELIENVKTSVKKYVDTIKNNIEDYHVLVFSGSGGSGSLVGQLLLGEMLKKDMTVIVIVVGDTSNLLYLNNTLKAILGLHNIAKSNKNAVSVAYFSNNVASDVTTNSSEDAVNNDILKLLEAASIFVSQNIGDIDMQDMRNFFTPSRYKTFNLEPGIYKLSLSSKTEKSENVLLLRTMTIQGIDVVINKDILHNKTGYLTEGHVKEIIGEHNLPIYMSISKNYYNTLVSLLDSKYKEMEHLKSVKSDALNSLAEQEEYDDLVL